MREPALPANLEEFLAAGPPPVVFTLGSAAVLAAGRFYEFSAQGGHPAGDSRGAADWEDPRNRPRQELPRHLRGGVCALTRRCFRERRMVVHQGGVGTTAQCLRAGKPMLIMPYSHDQPDNARRMRRLKVARVIQRAHYTPLRVARKLKAMLEASRDLPCSAQSVARHCHFRLKTFLPC
jgi:rhamnosyltransferase subunit B